MLWLHPPPSHQDQLFVLRTPKQTENLYAAKRPSSSREEVSQCWDPTATGSSLISVSLSSSQIAASQNRDGDTNIHRQP